MCSRLRGAVLAGTAWHVCGVSRDMTLIRAPAPASARVIASRWQLNAEVKKTTQVSVPPSAAGPAVERAWCGAAEQAALVSTQVGGVRVACWGVVLLCRFASRVCCVTCATCVTCVTCRACVIVLG